MKECTSLGAKTQKKHAVPTYCVDCARSADVLCWLGARLLWCTTTLAPPPLSPFPSCLLLLSFFPGPTCLAFPLSLSLSLSLLCFTFLTLVKLVAVQTESWKQEAFQWQLAKANSSSESCGAHPWPPTPPLTPLPFYLLPPGPGKRKREKL